MTSLVWQQVGELRDVEQNEPSAGVDVVIQAAAQRQFFNIQPSKTKVESQKVRGGDMNLESRVKAGFPQLLQSPPASSAALGSERVGSVFLFNLFSPDLVS